MFYCGIDIAKFKHEASVIDSDGKALLNSISFSNTQDGCEQLIALFTKLNISSDAVVIGMEATGHYWLSVYAHLSEIGYNVKVVNPIQSDAFRKMYIRQTKNDSKDSFIIAQMFPEYDKLFSDTFGATSTELLRKCPTPEEMLTVSTKKLTAMLKKSSRGRFGESKAAELKALAKSSFGIAFARDAFSFQIKQLMEQLVFIEKQIEELEKEISTLLNQTNQVITTIPGVGETLGAIILSEIGDIHRFDAPNKLVAFAGLDVKVTQSGEFIGSKNKISRRGSPYLRRAIWLAAN